MMFNSSVLFGDMEKCFRIFLSELYNNTASGSPMVAEVVVRLTDPLAAWEEYDTGCHIFQLLVDMLLSLHCNYLHILMFVHLMELRSNGLS